MPKYENQRIPETLSASALHGDVRYAPAQSIWITSMWLGALLGGWLFFSWSGLILFLVTSAVTLCAGHSVGMHRRLIHRSFECPLWLEHILVYLGTLVGLGGPLRMLRTHDMRDWAQRQSQCHAFFGHERSMLVDAWWQLHCRLVLSRPTKLIVESKIAEDRFYRFLDRTHYWQQLPWALLLLAIGGWGWVFWGICARVAVSITGHWFVGYFAHNRGGQHWRVEGAAVQGYDVPFCGLITFGECWHNNHHAFPGSAKLGLYRGQIDPGWWLIATLKKTGLVWNIRTVQQLPHRPELQSLDESTTITTPR